MADAEFSGEIKVASRIVDYLSSGLYESPAACLKELVNNSYDADARTVRVFVKPDANRIIIDDDGRGMTRAEFQKHFSNISESHKRDGGDKTKSGRPKIGKIGIGFIAANEICDVMEIFSTQANDPDLLHVSINFAGMRTDPERRVREGDSIAKADYVGSVSKTDRSAHYTKLFLKQIRGEAKNILASATRAHHGQTELPSLYGLNPDSVAAILSEPWLRSWSDLDPYSSNLLQIALNVPVRYHDEWLPSRLQNKVTNLEEAVAKLKFTVSYDGSDLRRPIVLPATDKTAILERFAFKGKHVSGHGYFFAQHGALKPQELNGLLIRIRQAAVGSYDKSFLDFPISEGTLFQRWISSEVWADDRLEEAMNIDRRTLRVAHPAYVEFQEKVHSYFTKFLRRARNELWQKASDTRKKEAAAAALETLREVVSETLPGISKEAAEDLLEVWWQAEEDSTIRRRLSRKYSVVDVYQIAIEAGGKMLTPSQRRQFIRALSERLASR